VEPGEAHLELHWAPAFVRYAGQVKNLAGSPGVLTLSLNETMGCPSLARPEENRTGIAPYRKTWIAAEVQVRRH
jgi:hypothetical protein